MILGNDLSLWQTEDAYNKNPDVRIFDSEIAETKGIKFTFLKASEGVTQDPKVERFVENLGGTSIPYSFYHFARPEWTYGAQVDRFLEIVSQFGEDTQLPLVLDLERAGCGLEFAKAFLGRLASKTGKKPMLYTSKGFWNSLIGHEKAYWAAEYYLWIARYPNLSVSGSLRGIPAEVESGSPFTKANGSPDPILPFDHWDFWQFSASGDGEYFGGDYDPRYENRVALDLNVYNGDLIDLYAEFGVGQETDQKHVRVIARQNNGAAGWLFFRNEPSFDYEEDLAIGYGALLELIDDEPINGLWHVKTARGREGYVSAGEAYTKKVT